MDFSSEKYMPAALPELCVPRGKLLDILNQRSGGRLLYIQAPAGYGKTVTVNLWLKERKKRHLWIALDEYDNNPELFYRLLCSAVAHVQGGENTEESMGSTGMFSNSPIEHAMLLTSRIKNPGQPVYIILDDLHSIVQEDILQSFPFFIRRLPAKYRFIMISRIDMPEKLQEILGEKAEYVWAEDLIFSKMEIQELFRTAGHNLSADESESVMNQTGGWAIAVSLLAVNEYTPDFSRGEENGLYQYMETRIWNQLSAKERNMLLAASVVNEFTEELFRRLTTVRNPGQVIMELLQRSLFLSRIGEDLYRFHALFLSFLRRHQTELHIDIRKLYKIAAQYYCEKGETYTARHFAIQGGNIKFLASQIYGESQYMGFSNNRSMNSYVSGIGVYIDKLPAESYQKYPYLNISAVWYRYLTGNVEKMTEALDRLYKSLKRIALFYPEFLELTILVCTLDPRKKFLTIVQQFDKLPPIKIRHDRQQGASITVNMPFAHRCLRDYSEFYLCEDFDVKLEPSAGLLLKDNYKIAMLLIKAGFAYEKNQWREAVELCNLAGIEADAGTSDEILFVLFSHRWMALAAMGRDEECRQVSERIEKMLAEKEALYLMPNYKALKTENALREGMRKAAEEWLDEYFVHKEERLMLYRVYQYLTTVRALISLNRLDEAEELCLRLKRMAADFDREIDVAETDVLLAVCFYREFRIEEAADTMLGAIQILYKYRFIRPFSIEGAAVVPILKKCLSRVDSSPKQYEFDRRYVNEIYLAAQEQAGRRKGLPASDEPIKKLSKQQKNMLEYLAKGYTNMDISEETGLSVRTVKTHLFLAYEKLGVSSAAEAVSKARELSLI